ncbi:hypothetical protein [Bradyrhizobium tunisiense]|uniref:hypothetical protein n=1 Tax=Bradyrhizobium tunisiense TaxID=3278709 RepID=UPI0035D54765
MLIDVDRRRNCESVGATGEAQFAADSHVEHAKGYTDVQVDLVPDHAKAASRLRQPVSP